MTDFGMAIVLLLCVVILSALAAGAVLEWQAARDARRAADRSLEP